LPVARFWDFTKTGQKPVATGWQPVFWMNFTLAMGHIFEQFYTYKPIFEVKYDCIQLVNNLMIPSQT
jgi:hypothetical protein